MIGVERLPPAVAIAATLVLLAAGWTPAAAQVARDGGPLIDIDFGGTIAAGGSLGSAAAQLSTGGTGAPLTLFAVDYRTGVSVGPEVHVDVRATPHLTLEATGSWSRAELRSQMSGDFEDAAAVTAVDRTSLFTIEGSALWFVGGGPRVQPFVRGGAGWLRALTADNVLSGNGVVVTAGGGVKYWWPERSPGRSRRWGARAELRLVSRPGALPFGSRSRWLTPAAAGDLIFGF